ncbi:hypothetical protein GGF31_005320 [Allomyces arbusculus]|nr:hypothetical protein GGF31_005320 [Allomyces arbusculus]
MWQVEFVPFDALDVALPAENALDVTPPTADGAPPPALVPTGPAGLILCTSKGGMYVLGPNGTLLDANPLFFPRPRPYFAGYCYRTSMLERLGDSDMYLATNQWGEMALFSVRARFGRAKAVRQDPPVVGEGPSEDVSPAVLPFAPGFDPESDDGWASTDDDDDDDDDEDEDVPSDQTPLLVPQTVDDDDKGGWYANLQRHHVVRVETPPSGVPVLGVAVQRIGPADVLTGREAMHRVFMCLLTGECAVVDVSSVTVRDQDPSKKTSQDVPRQFRTLMQRKEALEKNEQEKRAKREATAADASQQPPETNTKGRGKKNALRKRAPVRTKRSNAESVPPPKPKKANAAAAAKTADPVPAVKKPANAARSTPASAPAATASADSSDAEVLTASAKRRKRRLESQAASTAVDSDDSDSDAGPSAAKRARRVKDFDDLQDKVKFGEVVQAPPTLKVSKKMEKRKLDATLKSTVAENAVRKGKSAAEKRQMEVERERMVQLYRDMKAKRELDKVLGSR